MFSWLGLGTAGCSCAFFVLAGVTGLSREARDC